MTAREIAARYKVHKEMIGGGWLGLKAGCVTDDTEMALALGAAVVAGGDWSDETQTEVDKAVQQYAEDFGFDLDEEGHPLEEEETAAAA